MGLEKKIGKFFAGVAIAGSLLFNGCQKEPFFGGEGDSSLTEGIKVELGEGYQMPGSLSKNYLSPKFSYKKSSVFGEGEMAFVQGATLNDTSMTDFVVVPGIYVVSSDMVSDSSIFSFPDSLYRDFSSVWNEDLYDGSMKPRGLILNNVILPDSSFLVSSNFSPNLFKVNKKDSIYEHEIFLKDSALIGISDMIYSETDNKVYATQQKYSGWGTMLPRDRRVISISLEDSLINEEFILPSSSDPISFVGFGLSIGNKIDIVENTKRGNKDSKFYISDSFAGTIYGVSEENEVGSLITGLRYPSSLAIRTNENILTTICPKTDQNFSQFLEFPLVVEFNVKNGKLDTIYTFSSENIQDYNTGLSARDSLENQIPIEFYLSTVLVEGEFESELYYTKSLTGDLGKIIFQHD